jgi:hypothetical protein
MLRDIYAIGALVPVYEFNTRIGKIRLLVLLRKLLHLIGIANGQEVTGAAVWTIIVTLCRPHARRLTAAFCAVVVVSVLHGHLPQIRPATTSASAKTKQFWKGLSNAQTQHLLAAMHSCSLVIETRLYKVPSRVRRCGDSSFGRLL